MIVLFSNNVFIGSISKNWQKTMNKIVVVVLIDWDNIIVQILEWMKMMGFFMSLKPMMVIIFFMFLKMVFVS
jgi:hypothetical protein